MVRRLSQGDMRLTMNVYVKSVSESQVDALAALSEDFSGTGAASVRRIQRT